MSKKSKQNQRQREKSRIARRWKRMQNEKINTIMGRKLVGLFLLVILALVGLAVRITIINANDGKRYERIVLNQNQQQYESRIIPFKRGDIRDRNGTILATSDKVYNLILDCKVVNSKVKDKEGKEVAYYIEPTVDTLVHMFGFEEQKIRDWLTSEETKESQYIVVAENLSISYKQQFEDYIELKDLDLERRDHLADLEKKEEKEESILLTDAERQELKQIRGEILYRSRIKGIWFEEDYHRVYPMNSLACDLIGFTYDDNTADWGIEGYYSEILNGTNGRQFGYFNTDADVEQTIIDPVPGKNVLSTIDVNIQQIIRSALENYAAKYSNGPHGEKAAENVGVVVMNPNTGEILGMDSSDWYDLNQPRLYTKEEFEAMTDAEYEAAKLELTNRWRNFCVADSFEPGSTFKPVTVAAAMDTATTDNRQKYFCDGLEVVKNATMHCVIYPGEHEELNLEGALRVSCNDVMMQVGAKLGVNNMLKYQDLFNFGMKTGIDLPGENAGVLHTAESMGDVELATASFGQGFTCTMIQEAAAFSAVVNGGYYYKPHVVSAITESSGAISEYIDAVVERQVISANVSSQIRGWLKEVVEAGGSGEQAKVPGYSMGGKTGTAQKVDPSTKSYEGDYVVSFIGCAPIDDPQVVVYVVVDTPNVENQGSSIYAQDVAREILTELLPYMNIFPEDPAATAAYLEMLAQQPEPEVQEQLPEEPVQEQPSDQDPGEQPSDQNPEGQPADQLPEGLPPEQGQGEPVLDTDIPAPPAEIPDPTVENGGNDLYTEGIPNGQQ